MQTRRCCLHLDIVEPIVRKGTETFFAHLTVAESDITVVAVVDDVGKVDSFIKHFLIRTATNVVERGYDYEGILIGRVGHITYLERPRSSVLSVESEVELQCIERYAEARQYQVLRSSSSKLYCLGRCSVSCFGLYDTRTTSTWRYLAPAIGKRVFVYRLEVLVHGIDISARSSKRQRVQQPIAISAPALATYPNPILCKRRESRNGKRIVRGGIRCKGQRVCYACIAIGVLYAVGTYGQSTSQYRRVGI